MKHMWMVLAVAAGSLAMAGSAVASPESAFEQRKRVSIDLCTTTVAKRTGSSNLSVYGSQSFENFRTVWIEVQPGHLQFKCVVEKNGPSSYYIKSVRQL